MNDEIFVLGERECWTWDRVCSTSAFHCCSDFQLADFLASNVLHHSACFRSIISREIFPKRVPFVVGSSHPAACLFKCHYSALSAVLRVNIVDTVCTHALSQARKNPSKRRCNCYSVQKTLHINAHRIPWWIISYETRLPEQSPSPETHLIPQCSEFLICNLFSFTLIFTHYLFIRPPSSTL